MQPAKTFQDRGTQTDYSVSRTPVTLQPVQNAVLQQDMLASPNRDQIYASTGSLSPELFPLSDWVKSIPCIPCPGMLPGEEDRIAATAAAWEKALAESRSDFFRSHEWAKNLPTDPCSGKFAGQDEIDAAAAKLRSPDPA